MQAKRSRLVVSHATSGSVTTMKSCCLLERNNFRSHHFILLEANEAYRCFVWKCSEKEGCGWRLNAIHLVPLSGAQNKELFHLSDYIPTRFLMSRRSPSEEFISKLLDINLRGRYILK